MVLWSRPFIFGDKAIFLMDVHGAFDGEAENPSTPEVFKLPKHRDTLIAGMTFLTASQIVQA